MVYLRYGCFKTTGKPVRSYNEVAKIIDNNPSMVFKQVNRFAEDGESAFVDGRLINGYSMDRVNIPQDQKMH